MRTFEDFHEGDTIALGTYEVTEDEILRFAEAYDPQPFHLDRAAADLGPFDGLAASGWHTAAIFMRLYVDAVLAHSTSRGSPGVESLRWRAPVRPGDVLTGDVTVVTTRRSRNDPDRGTVVLDAEVRTTEGTTVMTLRAWGHFGRRDAA